MNDTEGGFKGSAKAKLFFLAEPPSAELGFQKNSVLAEPLSAELGFQKNYFFWLNPQSAEF